MSDTEGSVDDPGVPLARNTDDKFNVLHMGYKALVISFNLRPS